MTALTYVEIAVIGLAVSFSLEMLAARTLRAALGGALAWIGAAGLMSSGWWIRLWHYECGPKCGADAELFVGGAILAVLAAVGIVLKTGARPPAFALARAFGAGVVASLIMSMSVGFGAR